MGEDKRALHSIAYSVLHRCAQVGIRHVELLRALVDQADGGRWPRALTPRHPHPSLATPHELDIWACAAHCTGGFSCFANVWLQIPGAGCVPASAQGDFSVASRADNKTADPPRKPKKNQGKKREGVGLPENVCVATTGIAASKQLINKLSNWLASGPAWSYNEVITAAATAMVAGYHAPACMAVKKLLPRALPPVK
jgi:hypothetical protein